MVALSWDADFKPGYGNLLLAKTLDHNLFLPPSSKCLTVRVKLVTLVSDRRFRVASDQILN